MISACLLITLSAQLMAAVTVTRPDGRTVDLDDTYDNLVYCRRLSHTHITVRKCAPNVGAECDCNTDPLATVPQTSVELLRARGFLSELDDARSTQIRFILGGLFHEVSKVKDPYRAYLYILAFELFNGGIEAKTPCRYKAMLDVNEGFVNSSGYPVDRNIRKSSVRVFTGTDQLSGTTLELFCECARWVLDHRSSYRGNPHYYRIGYRYLKCEPDYARCSAAESGVAYPQFEVKTDGYPSQAAWDDYYRQCYRLDKISR